MPLDLTRRFDWDDADEEMDRFLGQAGFLHVAGVFTEDEMAAVSADMDRAAPSYAPGDGRSWWARTDDGTDRLVRMQGFDAMSADGRLARRRRAPGPSRARSPATATSGAPWTPTPSRRW